MKHEITKTFEEIQEAHDIFHAIITDELEGVGFGPDAIQPATAALNVLCWILGHDGGEGFKINLDMAKKMIEDAGYKPVRIQ